MNFAPLARLPKSAISILKEFSRHVLRRPVVGVLAIARDSDGRYLLIRRSDTGTWCFPGGTIDWGETVREALVREVREETGARVCEVGKLVGVYGRADRDPRFHAVSIAVEVTVDVGKMIASNPIEIREVGLFEYGDIPHPLAMGTEDVLRDAVEGNMPRIE